MDGVRNMAVKFISVKCPDCGAVLPIEEGRNQVFCSYCGSQIVMTNENEYIYRHTGTNMLYDYVVYVVAG